MLIMPPENTNSIVDEEKEPLTLTIHATKEKETKNYIKYLVTTEEDPPEFLPNNSIYVGKHLEGFKRVIIELEDKKVNKE